MRDLQISVAVRLSLSQTVRICQSATGIREGSSNISFGNHEAVHDLQDAPLSCQFGCVSVSPAVNLEIKCLF